MKKTKDKVDIRSLQIRMIITYVVALFLGIYALSSIIINVSNRILSNKVASLIKANSHQIELNINDYLNNIETITTLLFADEKYYKYDPVAHNYDEYTRIQNEKIIADRIADLGLMHNFTDFAVVYANGNRVGWTSNTTAALYDAEELYNVLSAYITDSITDDGWAFGVGGVTDRLFYVKRLNKNAIIMTAFYSRELETVFDYPSELEGMVINLVDVNNTILFSSEDENIANTLDKKIAEIIKGNQGEYIANAHYCENGWSVVCSIPSSVILRETNFLRRLVMMYSLAIAAFMAIVGLVFFTRMFKPVDTAVEQLKEEAVRDKLSCLLNKQSFNSEVCKQLSTSAYRTPRAFIMIDVDNFKQINDNFGHAYGDDVIRRMGSLIQQQFDDKYITGRLGGDEFAIYNESDGNDVSEETTAVVNIVTKLFDAFNIEFAEEKKKIDLSLSVGIAVLSHERRFENLYKSADEALYESKKAGKNRYTIFEKKEEEVQ